MQPNVLGETLSPSQTKAFLDCQWRWWAKHGLGLIDPPNANLVRGRVVHRMAETYFRVVLSGTRPAERTKPAAASKAQV